MLIISANRHLNGTLQNIKLSIFVLAKNQYINNKKTTCSLFWSVINPRFHKISSFWFSNNLNIAKRRRSPRIPLRQSFHNYRNPSFWSPGAVPAPRRWGWCLTSSLEQFLYCYPVQTTKLWFFGYSYLAVWLVFVGVGVGVVPAYTFVVAVMTIVDPAAVAAPTVAADFF